MKFSTVDLIPSLVFPVDLIPIDPNTALSAISIGGIFLHKQVDLKFYFFALKYACTVRVFTYLIVYELFMYNSK